jgi:hypothetical protein
MKTSVLLENNKNFILTSNFKNKDENTVRVIYDYNSIKLTEQYRLLYNILPKHELYIYQHEEPVSNTVSTYNIYLDTINEFCYYNLKTKYTILFVNDEYVSYKYSKYLRREQYKDEPLKKLETVVNFYFCVTKYSVNVLLKKWKIPINKIVYLSNIFNIRNKFKIDTILAIKKNVQKYILFDIDIYENVNNIAVLEIWIKYYININTKLVIHIGRTQRNDKIIEYIKQLVGQVYFMMPFIKYYHNIIITNDLTILNYKYYAIILNVSNFNSFYKVYHYLLLKKIVIVNNNSITRKIFNNKMFLYSDINKININIDILFNSSIDNIKKIPNYLTYRRSNINKIFKNFLFNKNPYTIPIFANPVAKIVDSRDFISSHNKIISFVVKIDNDFKNTEPNTNKYFRFIKHPKNKTDFCYATCIIINNSYLPSILVAGYKLKQITEYNIVCFVQDKPYFENGQEKFPGLNSYEIKQIKQIYDCVIGIDIINQYFYSDAMTNYTLCNRVTYPHIQLKQKIYYLTKILIFSFTYYKKIFYNDGGSLINTNLDTIFTNNQIMLTQVHENIINFFTGFYLIIPKKYYITKFFYLVNNFYSIFIKNKFECKYHVYHYLIFYTIYPNYKINNEIKFHSGKDADRYNDNYKLIENQEIFIYSYRKPFRYSIMSTELERDLFLLNYIHYYPWDITVQELLKKYPTFKKFFRYIKTFRYTKFTI